MSQLERQTKRLHLLQTKGGTLTKVEAGWIVLLQEVLSVSKGCSHED